MKSVLITGCSSGLGHFIAKEFLKRGDKVYVTSRNASSLIALKDLGAVPLEVNLEDEKDIEKIRKSLNSLDILINNAGYAQVAPILELDSKAFESQFRINLFAPHALIKTFVPLLVKSSNPLIVNIGSMSGVMATPFAGAYCSSKAAINIYTDVLRMELASLGIKVVKVLPGVFKSSFGSNAEKSIIGRSSKYYGDLNEILKERAQASQVFSSPTEKVAKKIVNKLTVRRVKSTMVVARGALMALFIGNYIPNIIKDYIFKKKFRL